MNEEVNTLEPCQCGKTSKKHCEAHRGLAWAGCTLHDDDSKEDDEETTE